MEEITHTEYSKITKDNYRRNRVVHLLRRFVHWTSNNSYQPPLILHPGEETTRRLMIYDNPTTPEGALGLIQVVEVPLDD